MGLRIEQTWLAPAASSTRLSDVVAERISDAIRNGVLRPGEKLPSESAIARQMKVGRTSVREGLQRLRVLGIIEGRQGACAQVADRDPLSEFRLWASSNATEITDLVESRLANECLAAALAALRATRSDIKHLEDCHKRHEQAAKSGDIANLTRTDQAFHSAIFDIARNPLLAKLFGLMAGDLQEFWRQTLSVPAAPARSATGHLAILKAIKAGEAIAARRAMANHLWILYSEVSAAAASGASRAQPAKEVFF
jgi:GntR family transcriptional repressor for pyruvate dehydrogenase complex